MEAHYPKYLLYGLIILGSWLLSSLLHFQFFHLSLSSSFAVPRRSATLVALPVALDAKFLPSPAVEADDRRWSAPSSSPLCEGRYVHMVNLPSRFNVLRDCVEGSPLFDNMWSWCAITVNGGLGPEIGPAGNSGDGETSIIPSTGWYSTDQYSLEVIFHNRMRRYECLTDDPAAATAVYVPYYPAIELHQHLCGFNTTMRDGPSSEFLRWLSSRPAWAAHGGRDHFMVAAKTTWMFRRQPGGNDEGCGNNFLGQPESGNMSVLTYESNVWARRDFAVPYPSYFHPSSAGEVAAWQARARAAPRPYLFAFAGARRPNGTLAIRDRVFDVCEAAARRGRCGILDCSHGLEGSITCRTAQKVASLFASARFCLQPRGDSFMRRSSIDSIMAGCIPVFFHRISTLKKQYLWHEPEPGRSNDDGDDDRQYYVLINSDDVLEGRVDIEKVLSRYTDEEVAAMREELIKMIPRFMYKDPRVRFEGDMKDAFDIAMDQVLERMRRIKNGEEVGWKDESDEEVANDS
ncbi:probable xyloglucan galactosyltransferase GT11 [Phragmites australis]|uniref:probable xyloglucan galactosyltransferase GT11 n=1 Tax=Phragmites australis TaxID=29695 RepID=UPI002D779F33|nr:probable xyloglucan galactosyltransferase GT11 [Phragmites australis]